jgi:Phosphoribosyl transferase domain
VADALGAPLDVFLVRKLGVPGREELAMGAIGSGGTRVLNDEVVRSLGIPEETIASVAAEEQRELERRERLYRDGGSPSPVADKTAILVDDGLATGASMRAAALALRQQGAIEGPVGRPSHTARRCGAAPAGSRPGGASHRRCRPRPRRGGSRAPAPTAARFPNPRAVRRTAAHPSNQARSDRAATGGHGQERSAI